MIFDHTIEDTIKKDVKELTRNRNKFRKEFHAATNYYNRKQIIERVKIIKEHIIDTQKERKQNT